MDIGVIQETGQSWYNKFNWLATNMLASIVQWKDKQHWSAIKLITLIYFFCFLPFVIVICHPLEPALEEQMERQRYGRERRGMPRETQRDLVGSKKS